jgi:hypothetical protein
MNIPARALIGGLALLSTVNSSQAAAWSFENVDTGANVGHAVSMTLDTAGYPHISYFRPSSTMGFSDLSYATRTGSTWSKETIEPNITNGTQGSATSIAVTELGNPAVSFTRSGTFVRYTIRNGGSWLSPVTVSNTGGGFSSIVWQGTEAAPTPQVAFNDSAANDLRVAVMNAGAFTSQALDTSVAAAAFCSLAQVGSYMGVAYIDGSKLGFWQSLNAGMNWGEYSSNPFAPFSNIQASVCALALAPTRNNTFEPAAISAHILYFDGTTRRYNYVTNDTDTGVWATPALVLQCGTTNTTQTGCSIAVDAAGVIHVALLDNSEVRLAYAKRASGGWSSAEYIDGANLGGAFCTIKVNAQGQPSIAYSTLAFNSGSSTYEVDGVRFAQLASAAPVAPLSFAISGKKKITTSKSKVTLKGTCSTSATAIQWRLGKGKFRSQAVAGTSWKVKVKKLQPGQNKIELKAVSATGATTARQKVKVLVTD